MTLQASFADLAPGKPLSPLPLTFLFPILATSRFLITIEEVRPWVCITPPIREKF